MLTLHVLQGPDRGRHFQLPQGEPQLIGRSTEALPISDTSVSRRHAELTPDDGSWYVRDLESANGTFLNGERIFRRVRLSPGDQIRCGATLLVFGLSPEEQKTTAVDLIGDEAMDAAIERRVDGEEHSLLAAVDARSAAAVHLRVIYELTTLTASVVDRDVLLGKVMDLVFEEFQPDRGFVLLQQSPADRPEPVVVRYRERPKTLDEGRIPVSRTIVQHTLSKGEGILSANALNDTRFQSADSVRAYGIRTAMCVPIRTAERIFGVLHIDSSMADFTYNEAQLRLMNAIGQHTGLALQSAESISQRMNQERLAAMGETVATVSHSIKNILQGLRGGADAVELAINRRDLELATEGWPILSRNLDRIYSLTMNMLAYSKQRTLEPDLRPVEPLIEEIVDLVQPHCKNKQVAILTELDETMPPIPIDGNALHQALINLVLNAIEAVPEKKGLVTIRTCFDETTSAAKISIADNGKGIPPDQQATIFEAFRSTKGQRGTGLGLAVTKKIIEEHGGSIQIESTTGDPGTIFTITLPGTSDTLDSGRTKQPKPKAMEEFDEDF